MGHCGMIQRRGKEPVVQMVLEISSSVMKPAGGRCFNVGSARVKNKVCTRKGDRVVITTVYRREGRRRIIKKQIIPSPADWLTLGIVKWNTFIDHTLCLTEALHLWLGSIFQFDFAKIAMAKEIVVAMALLLVVVAISDAAVVIKEKTGLKDAHSLFRARRDLWGNLWNGRTAHAACAGRSCYGQSDCCIGYQCMRIHSWDNLNSFESGGLCYKSSSSFTY
ncbi:hypothetical protein ScPMuIL_009730 [Solemya velum]